MIGGREGVLPDILRQLHRVFMHYSGVSSASFTSKHIKPQSSVWRQRGNESLEHAGSRPLPPAVLISPETGTIRLLNLRQGSAGAEEASDTLAHETYTNNLFGAGHPLAFGHLNAPEDSFAVLRFGLQRTSEAPHRTQQNAVEHGINAH